MLTSIRTALAAIFTVLAVVTGLQGAFIFKQLVQAEMDVHSVADRQLPSLTAIRDLSTWLLRVRNKQFRLVLSDPIDEVVERAAADLQAEMEALQASRRTYDAFVGSDAEREVHARMSRSLDGYMRLTSNLPDLMRSGRVDQARQQVLQPWLRVLYMTADSELRSAVTLINGRAQTNAEAGVAALTHAKYVALISSIAAACLASLAVVFSYLRILRPLGTVTRALNQLAAGDVAVDRVPMRRRDEIGAIGRAVEAFRTSIVRARQAENERRDTELLVHNIAASTPDGIVAFDDAGVVTFWNGAAEHLLGMPADAAIGMPVELALPSDALLRSWPVGTVDREGASVETQVTRHDGTSIPVELSHSRWQQDGRTMSCAILRDIRGRKRDEAVLHRLAHTDALTELPNRVVFTSRLAAALAEERRFAVLMIDLDHFKQVNDVFGHQTGDDILKTAARRLSGSIPSGDTVTRIGGDEFILLAQGQSDPLAAAALADTLVQVLGEPFTVGGRTIHLGASVGVALAPDHGTDPDELMTCADLALYSVKAQGRRGHRLFTSGLRGAAVRDSSCRQELPRAVERGEFTLFFQPQVRLSDGAVIGAEALIRWQHPELGLVAPNAFMPVLENSHLAEEVGDWVIRTACRQTAEWRRIWPEFRTGVNLSNAHFRSGRLAGTVRRLLDEAGLPPSGLEVEITEHIMLHHDDRMIEPLRELQALGVHVAFDDYGTGYASLSLLQRFPLNRLKIDRSFIRNMAESPGDAAIVRTILALGHSLGLGVIAEGIETEEQAEHLRASGCTEAQGYLFGRPMPAAAFTAAFGTAARPARRLG